jgi:hypothetical protein
VIGIFDRPPACYLVAEHFGHKLDDEDFCFAPCDFQGLAARVRITDPVKTGGCRFESCHPCGPQQTETRFARRVSASSRPLSLYRLKRLKLCALLGTPT